MSDTPDELTVASIGPVGVHYTRCWGCMTGQCPGGHHRWADEEDIDHAVQIGKPETAEGRCGCPCYDEPERQEEPDPDDNEPVSIETSPCNLCGATAECGYDGDGRAYIHTLTGEDE